MEKAKAEKCSECEDCCISEMGAYKVRGEWCRRMRCPLVKGQMACGAGRKRDKGSPRVITINSNGERVWSVREFKWTADGLCKNANRQRFEFKNGSRLTILTAFTDNYQAGTKKWAAGCVFVRKTETEAGEEYSIVECKRGNGRYDSERQAWLAVLRYVSQVADELKEDAEVFAAAIRRKDI